MDEKERIRNSILYPVLFVGILWILKAAEMHFHFSLVVLGVQPRTVEGLVGIFTSPFIHAGYDHLLSNTLPLLVVGAGMIYFYREISFRVIAMIWLFTGFWVWIAARPEPHIGASGLIYGLVCFLFFSGVLRQDRRLLAISMLVTFLYGSMVWGILPVNQTISWESHLYGSLAGIFAALYFRKEGPQRTVKVWEEEEEVTISEPQYWMTEEQKRKIEQENKAKESLTGEGIEVKYIYKEKEEGDSATNPPQAD